MSKANVSAAYDPLSDRIVLTARYTGEMSISVEDVGGNFLAAAGLPGAEQQYGVNALFRVEGISGGAQLSSASNTVKGIISNATLTLKEVSENPATITVAQNVDSAYGAIKSFVDQYNSVMDLLATQTAYDKDKKTAGPLQGDVGQCERSADAPPPYHDSCEWIAPGLNSCWPSGYPQELRARATSDQRSSRSTTPSSRAFLLRIRRQWRRCSWIVTTASPLSSNHISAS